MPKPTKTSILLADDHVLLLDLWDIGFARDNRFYICGKAPSGTVAVEMARATRPDIVLLDLTIGPIDGFEATRLIRNCSPRSKVIAVADQALPSSAKKIKAMGAMGYVTKYAPLDEMIFAIQEVKKGKFYYCNTMQKILRAEEKMMGQSALANVALTNREVEIIHLIQEGFSSRGIGEKLSISPKTVHIHRSRIFKKLQVTNMALLIQAANLLGI